MKFGQLMEYDISNLFFKEKSYTKCGGKASPRLFYKKSKLRYGFGLWINSLKWYKVCFYCMP